MENVQEVVRCPACGELYITGELVDSGGGEPVCEYCYEDVLAEMYPSLLDSTYTDRCSRYRRRSFDDEE